MAILFGLASALAWGGGDFVLTWITRALGPLRALFIAQTVGIVVIGSLVLLSGEWPEASGGLWVLVIGANLFNLAGTFLLYRAFAIGKLAIVSPVASSYALVTALLAALSGERLGIIATIGAVAVIGGVIVAARSSDDGGEGAAQAARIPAGLREALGTSLCFGVFFWLVNMITPTFGEAWPILVGRVLASAVALIALQWFKPPLPGPVSPWIYALVPLASLLDTGGFLAFNFGINSGGATTIVTALSSIFSAVTVLLAWIFLRERLSRSQWIGIITIITGVALVSS